MSSLTQEARRPFSASDSLTGNVTRPDSRNWLQELDRDTGSCGHGQLPFLLGVGSPVTSTSFLGLRVPGRMGTPRGPCWAIALAAYMRRQSPNAFHSGSPSRI